MGHVEPGVFGVVGWRRDVAAVLHTDVCLSDSTFPISAFETWLLQQRLYLDTGEGR